MKPKKIVQSMPRKGYLKTLKSYECQSDKAIEAPLSKKNLSIKLEQPIQDLLDAMPTKDRLTLVRRAIAKELMAEGLLDLPQNN
jgi:hypothetical protein